MDDLVWQILLAGFAIFVVFKISLITYRRRALSPGPHYNWERDRYGPICHSRGDSSGGLLPGAHQIEGKPKTKLDGLLKKELARSAAARHATIGISGGTTSISCPR
ncbi:MAG: hypothetical protein CM15mP6_2900 [Methanobacteriota archaeon]|nr:MAG: hypothetical protein CM15mP6_2900 [Euryarchaeota archaeon]